MTKKLTPAEKAQMKRDMAAAAKRKNPANATAIEPYVSKKQTKNLIRQLVKELPKAEPGTPAAKMYKLFQTRDEHLIEAALGSIMRTINPYDYYHCTNLMLDTYIRRIPARNRVNFGLSPLAADGTTNGTGDKYVFVKFDQLNPLAPCSVLKKINKTYSCELPALKAGDGAGCNFPNDASSFTTTVAGTAGTSAPTSYTPLTHCGQLVGNNVSVHLPLNKKDVYLVDDFGNHLGLSARPGFKGKYAGFFPAQSGDQITVKWVVSVPVGYTPTHYVNCLFVLNDGTLTWGTGVSTAVNAELTITAPLNTAYALPFYWYTGLSAISPANYLTITKFEVIVQSGSWAWEKQYVDSADDMYAKMAAFCMNGYRFVITPENADAYKSGYTEVVRCPNLSFYTAPRSPVDYWAVIRQAQGLEQRSASMAGSGDEGQGVSGFLGSGALNGKMYTRTEVPDIWETTIFGFRQPAVPGGATFQDTTLEMLIEYAYEYQPAIYTDQQLAEYYPFNPEAESLAQNVICKMEWFRCNPEHSILDKASGWLNNAKNKIVAYGAEHPDVAPKVMAALTAIGMSFL